MDFTTATYILLGINFFLCFSLIIVVLILLNRRKKAIIYEKDLKMAEKVLKNAKEESIKILTESKYFSEEIKNELQKNFSEISEKYNQDLKDEVEKVIQNVSKDVTDFVRVELDGVNDKLNTAISESIKNAEDEIRKYKELRMSSIGKEVSERVNKISMEVLKKTLTSEDQEKLVFDALEEAKNDDVL